MAATELEPFHARLFQALSGERKFEDVLQVHAAEAGAVSGVIFALNRKTGEILDWTSPQLPFGDDAYSEHINSINPRMRYSMAHAPGHVAYEARFISDQAIQNSEFYDWLKREFDMKYFLGSRLFDEGDISVFHSIEFDQKKDIPQRDEIATFARKAQALANAWKISKHIRPSETQNLAQDFTPNYLPWAIFAVSQDGRVLSMNAQASNEIRSGDVFALADRLAPVRRQDQDKFSRVLRGAITGQRQEILIQSAVSRAKYIVQAVPVSGNVDVAALVYLWNPSYRSENLGEVLAKLWRLTNQEVKLVEALVAGASLREASDGLGITRNTGRNHLNSVFMKMEVNSQTELLVRVFGLLG